jgi:hypothetical protein
MKGLTNEKSYGPLTSTYRNKANYEIFNDTDYLLQYELFGTSDISLWLLVCLVS